MNSLTICLIICALTMASYIVGKIPMGLTAMLSMCAFIITGCLDPKTALTYIGNANGVMIVAMFVVAAGFTRTQFVKKCATSVNKIAKGSLTMVMLGYVLVAALLAQFIQSSVIVFGIMAPMMIATCEEMKINPSKTLFPLAIVSIATISALPLGSGATQAAELNGYLEANAYTDFVVALTDPMKARLPMLIAVMIYCIFFAVKFAPNAPVVRTTEMQDRTDNRAPLTPFKERAGYIIFILTTIALIFQRKIGIDTWVICVSGAVAMVGVRKGLPYLMIAPAMAVSLVFLVYPILYMFKLGFYKWNMVGEMTFIGLDNYVSLMTDPEFMQVLKNTCQFSFWTVAGCITLGMIFALYLNKNARFERLVQVIMFTPYVLPMISIAFIWMWIMDGDIGLLNYILGFFGIEKIRWLDDPQVAMYSLILVNIWKGVGYYTLIILSALQSIPKYIYEAAELDQAHPVTTFFKLTLPMLSPTLFFLSITAVISSFKVFETVNVMTAGEPQNSTTSLVYYIYQYGFQFYKIGYASAVGVILMVIVGIFTLVYFGCLQKKVHYQ